MQKFLATIATKIREGRQWLVSPKTSLQLLETDLDYYASLPKHKQSNPEVAWMDTVWHGIRMELWTEDLKKNSQFLDRVLQIKNFYNHEQIQEELKKLKSLNESSRLMLVGQGIKDVKAQHPARIL